MFTSPIFSNFSTRGTYRSFDRIQGYLVGGTTPTQTKWNDNPVTALPWKKRAGQWRPSRFRQKPQKVTASLFF